MLRGGIFFFIGIYAAEVAYADGLCANGFVESDTGYVGLYISVDNRCDVGGTLVSVPNTYIKKSETFCGPGYYPQSGACVPYESTGACASGFSESGTGYSGIQISVNNQCAASEIFVPVFNTYIKNSETFCGPGYYRSSDGCVAYSGDDTCPTNNYSPTNVLERVGDNARCATNYYGFEEMSVCKPWMSFSDQPDYCTPQLRCDAGANTLKTSTGLALPIYADRGTTPSMNFGFENGKVCYMNLLPGSESGTINIMYNNQTYHGTR